MANEIEISILKVLQSQATINAKLARGLMELSEVIKEHHKDRPMPLLSRVSDILDALESQLNLLNSVTKDADSESGIR